MRTLCESVKHEQAVDPARPSYSYISPLPPHLCRHIQKAQRIDEAAGQQRRDVVSWRVGYEDA